MFFWNFPRFVLGVFPGFSVLELAPLVLLWFESFCTSAVNIPGIVLTRQHPFQHPQHHEFDLLGWVYGGLKVGWGWFREGSRLV